MNHNDARARMLAYMEEHVTMTLATSGREGPHAATLFYASEGFDIYFLSSAETVHAQQVLSDPRVFVTISQDYADWQKIRGLQLRGSARILEDEFHAREVYIQKFPFVASFPRGDARYWHIKAEWARMIDNTIAFAHKDEITI